MNRRTLLKSVVAAVAGTILPIVKPKPTHADIWFDEASVMSPSHVADAAKRLKPVRGLRLVSRTKTPVYNDDGTLLGYREELHFVGEDPPCYVIQTTTPKRKRASV